MNRLLLCLLAGGAFLIGSSGCGSTPTATTTATPSLPEVDGGSVSDQADWQARQGLSWDVYEQAYEEGFEDGCDILIGIEAGGVAFGADGYELTTFDCTSLADPRAAAPFDEPADPIIEGARQGERDGCRALLEIDRVFGEDGEELTEADCIDPLGSRYEPPPRPRALPCVGIRLIFYMWGVRCRDVGSIWGPARRGSPPAGWSCTFASPAERPRLAECRGPDGAWLIAESRTP